MNDKAKTETPEQVQFRAHCREWLEQYEVAEPAQDTESKAGAHHVSAAIMEFRQSWQKAAYDAGLVGCDYPKEYGGGGHTDCQKIANEEMRLAGTPDFANMVALRLVAPTILTHGSEELKKRFIPRILSGEDIWCQGFSEPNAGSDVASLQTFAERKGDYWVINGQKVWTSLAQFSDWMILLCRTDRTQKHKGLTYFAVPIKENRGKSVEVRPLVQITGEAHFNQVFFTDLTIHDKYRLDEVGKGWDVAMTSLKFERNAGGLVEPVSGTLLQSNAKLVIDDSLPIIQLAKNSARNGKTAADDPVIRNRIMEIVIRQKAFEQSLRRSKVSGLVDNPLRIPLQGKLVMSEILQDLSALGVEIAGAGATLYIADENAPDGGSWPYQYLNSFARTIAAGTSEIQRNQLGERILDLPKSK